MKLTRKQERSLALGLGGVLVVAGTVLWYQAQVPLREVVAPLVSARTPVPVYGLIAEECTGGIRGECLVLTRSVWDGIATTTTVLAPDIADRYIAAGGKAKRLELGYVDAGADLYYFEEIFASQQPRVLYRFDRASGDWSKRDNWKHNPFAGDRSSPDRRYYARSAVDGVAIELFDVRSGATTTPLRLTSSDETLWATDCGNQGAEPRLHWQNETTLVVDVFAAGPKKGKVCAGPYLRSVTLVVE